MKHSVTVIGMALISVLAFVGFGKLAETIDKPKGFDPATISDVVEYTAGIPKDTVLATVDGQPITAENYLYWAGYVIEMTQYNQFGGAEIDWTATAGETTLSDYFKEAAFDIARNYRVIQTKAVELDCGLNKENKAAYQTARDQTVDSQGGETQFQKWLLTCSLPESGYATLYQTPLLFQNIVEAKINSDPATAEEMADYIAANDLLQAKHILLANKDLTTGQALTAEELEAKKAKAEELVAQLRESDDPVKLFDELMNQYSEDPGLATQPNGYLFTAGKMLPEFEQGTRALEFNEISDVIETKAGYHILLRLDPASDKLAASITEARVTEEVDALMSGWVEETEVETTEVYDNLDLESFYNNLLSLRAEIQAADAAAQAEAESTPAAN